MSKRKRSKEQTTIYKTYFGSQTGSKTITKIYLGYKCFCNQEINNVDVRILTRMKPILLCEKKHILFLKNWTFDRQHMCCAVQICFATDNWHSSGNYLCTHTFNRIIRLYLLGESHARSVQRTYKILTRSFHLAV